LIAFLHGFLGRPAMWQAIAECLSAQSFLATLPGHGPEPWFSKEGSFESVSEAMLAQLPSETSLLVGYSMGARLALSMLIKAPQRFTKAILIGVDPGLIEKTQRQQRILWDDSQASHVDSMGIKSFSEIWASLSIFETQKNLPEAIKKEQQKQRNEHTPNGISWATKTLGLGRMPPLWRELRNVQDRLHLVTGSEDPKFTEIAQEIRKVAPNTTHTIVEDVGHNVALEAPKQLVKILQQYALRAAKAGPL
jgi:2-succinyl-6-hydroxy-2,4-cyclohexadiene-1-carboxylate synthase